jgi:hypothetical protein
VYKYSIEPEPEPEPEPELKPDEALLAIATAAVPPGCRELPAISFRSTSLK